MGQNSAARRLPPAPVVRKIHLLNGLPARPSDDVEFVLRALSALKNEKGEVIGTGTTTAVVRSLGLADRMEGGSGGPTSQYLRIRAALQHAKDRGLVECESRRWWIAGS